MSKKKSNEEFMKNIVSLCKRRGFIFQSSEIYGGLNGCWDYGPLGVELKRNIKENWWRENVIMRDDMVGLDSSILMHPDVWKASGHVGGFNDPMVDCKKCKRRFRQDHVEGDNCPECGGELTDVKQFNLMFKTFVGPVEEEGSKTYLRPETAQGIFANFSTVQTVSRKKLPFGIAQVGKSFRNEITPRNFTFRTREFEQMEIEFFCKPGTEKEWFEHWKEKRIQWYWNLGLNKEKLFFRDHGEDELAHYANACVDIEYEFPFGVSELEGIASRTDYDLKCHMEATGKDLRYFDEQSREKYVPYVIEPSAGADRATLAFIIDAYKEEEVNGEKRSIMCFSPAIAPIKCAVFPLVKKNGLPEKASKIHKDLLLKGINSFYDQQGAIGRRYRRQDEVGTPFCLTVDHDSLEDNSVTVRNRDSMEQTRISEDA
ncbi:MAG: glycine--tRNA ligase, partial [Fibrobacterota bacterium]